MNEIVTYCQCVRQKGPWLDKNVHGSNLTLDYIISKFLKRYKFAIGTYS